MAGDRDKRKKKNKRPPKIKASPSTQSASSSWITPDAIDEPSTGDEFAAMIYGRADLSPPDALEMIQKSTKFTDHPAVLTLKAILLSHLDYVDESYEVAVQLKEMGPDIPSAPIYNILGEMYMMQEKFRDAYSCFSSAAKYVSDDHPLATRYHKAAIEADTLRVKEEKLLEGLVEEESVQLVKVKAHDRNHIDRSISLVDKPLEETVASLQPDELKENPSLDEPIPKEESMQLDKVKAHDR